MILLILCLPPKFIPFLRVVYNIENITNNFYYYSLKTKVLGITFTNSKREFLSKSKHHIFQFNFQFNQKKDKIVRRKNNQTKKTVPRIHLIKK